MLRPQMYARSRSASPPRSSVECERERERSWDDTSDSDGDSDVEAAKWCDDQPFLDSLGSVGSDSYPANWKEDPNKVFNAFVNSGPVCMCCEKKVTQLCECSKYYANPCGKCWEKEKNHCTSSGCPGHARCNHKSAHMIMCGKCKHMVLSRGKCAKLKYRYPHLREIEDDPNSIYYGRERRRMREGVEMCNSCETVERKNLENKKLQIEREKWEKLNNSKLQHEKEIKTSQQVIAREDESVQKLANELAQLNQVRMNLHAQLAVARDKIDNAKVRLNASTEALEQTNKIITARLLPAAGL
jgi:hypothetical protein